MQSMNPRSRIRLADIDDAETLARLHIHCWHETYATLLSPAFFDKQSVEERLAMWSQMLNSPHKNRQYVAEVEGKLVGFAGSLPHQDNAQNGVAELWGIYLLKEYHGSGLGQQLLEATLGQESAALWTAEDNPRAKAFYGRNGFELTGERTILEDWEGIALVRMTR